MRGGTIRLFLSLLSLLVVLFSHVSSLCRLAQHRLVREDLGRVRRNQNGGGYENDENTSSISTDISSRNTNSNNDSNNSHFNSLSAFSPYSASRLTPSWICSRASLCMTKILASLKSSFTPASST